MKNTDGQTGAPDGDHFKPPPGARQQEDRAVARHPEDHRPDVGEEMSEARSLKEVMSDLATAAQEQQDQETREEEAQWQPQEGYVLLNVDMRGSWGRGREHRRGIRLDYGGMDMTGKILLMLVNDPPLEDENRFGGDAMTYYGRWTYKFEQAERLGAAGAIVIHTLESASYQFSVIGVLDDGWPQHRYVS